MAVIKCKMCGGDLEVSEDMTVAECEYCGTKQTVPKVDDEKKIKLFERANRLRAACEFDKAAGVYESIVSDFEFEAEAYWGLVLCKYGIEYVDDPATKKKVPTCHRSSFESVQDDPNFELALENADHIAGRVYRQEAHAIEELRKGIIEVSSKEEPYDIFISYKELADDGDRTLDSVIAQDIYTELTEKGYRVFFSRITLEDKLGTEYEPYIFAALNSAKLMLVVGTDYDYFNAVWVKNEWSRFLALMARGEKKTLIPCFKGIDAYDMPKEFAKLSAQDMGKVGAMQDLLRGVEKIIPRKKEEAPAAAPVYRSESDAKTTAALDRGNMALEDDDFDKADEYFEQALTLDAKCAEAYWGKVLAAAECRNDDEWVCERLSVPVTPRSEFVCPVNMAHLEAMNKKYCIPGYFETQYVIANYEAPEKYDITSDQLKKQLDNERRYYKTDKLITRAEKFASGEFKAKLSKNMKSVLTEMEKRISEAEAAEDAAVKAGVAAYGRNIELGNEQVKAKHAEAAKKRDADYDKACEKMKADTVADYEAAIRLFKVMAEGNYKDSAERIKQCEARIAEEKRIAKEKAAEADRLKREQNKEALAPLRVRSAKYGRMISASNMHIVAAREDGTVKSTDILSTINDKGQCKVQNMRNITAVAVTSFRTFGIKSDGTVTVVGDHSHGTCKVSGWRDIVEIHPSSFYTVGLRSDGTVIATQYGGPEKDNFGQCDVSEWRDIVSVATHGECTVGLKSDGTLITTKNKDGKPMEPEILEWKDITAIAASYHWIIGLRSDGTVVSNYPERFPSITKWRDIVAIDVGSQHVVGLKSDGSVVSDGANIGGQCDVSKWRNIVGITAGSTCTIGIKSDGTSVSTGELQFSSYTANGWKLCKSVEEYAAENAARIQSLTEEKAQLTAELPTIKGMFAASKKEKVEARIAEIDKEIAELQ